MRIPLTALAVGLALLVSALPANAASIASCRSEQEILPDGTVTTRIQAEASQLRLLLRQQGYNVDYIEDWGGCVKAVIDNPDGTSHILFFDPDTLEPLSTK